MIWRSGDQAGLAFRGPRLHHVMSLDWSLQLCASRRSNARLRRELELRVGL
jgi:hypothetical protein